MGDRVNSSTGPGAVAVQLRHVGEGWPDCPQRPSSGMPDDDVRQAQGERQGPAGKQPAEGDGRGVHVSVEPRGPSSGASAGSAEAGRGLPVLPPLVAFVELASVVGLIMLVDWALPDVDLADLQPHPLWLPVLLLSLQYGTVSGLLAALVAIVVTVLAGFPEEGVGENHFSYVLRIWSQPILWIGAAVLLGQLRMRQITERQELMRHASELAVERDNLASYASELRRRCELLERGRAAGVDAPAVSLLQALGGLPTAPGDVDAAFKRCMDLAFPGAKASVFALTPPGARKIADNGWDAEARWLTEVPSTHALYRAVVDEGLSLNVIVAGDEVRLAGEGMVAVPIRSLQQRRIVGFVKIERAPAAAISDETTAALDVVAAALLPAIEPGELRLLALPTRLSVSAQPRTWRTIRWRAGQPPPEVREAETEPERVRPRIVR